MVLGFELKSCVGKGFLGCVWKNGFRFLREEKNVLRNVFYVSVCIIVFIYRFNYRHKFAFLIFG